VTTLVDCRYAALNLQVTPDRHVDDMLFDWYALYGGTGNTHADREYSMLVAQGATPSTHVDDMWREVLILAGFNTAGEHIDDLLHQFWCVGGGTFLEPDIGFDASNDDEFTFGVGDRVANWGLLAQPVPGNQPERIAGVLNGKPIVRFSNSGSEHLFSFDDDAIETAFSGVTSFSMWSVHSARNTINDGGIVTGIRVRNPNPTAFGAGDFAKPSAFYIGDSMGTIAEPPYHCLFKSEWSPEGPTNPVETGDISGGFYIVHFRVTSTAFESYVNNVLIESEPVGIGISALMDSLAMGCRIIGGAVAPGYSDLDMAEWRLYSGISTSATINLIYNQLRTKWIPASPMVYLP